MKKTNIGAYANTPSFKKAIATEIGNTKIPKYLTLSIIISNKFNEPIMDFNNNSHLTF